VQLQYIEPAKFVSAGTTGGAIRREDHSLPC